MCVSNKLPTHSSHINFINTIKSDGGPIPNRPYGTIAYVLTIIRCPEWYEPGVDGTPDPGEDLFEMTAVIKDEICNATDTAKEFSDSDFLHTL